MWWYNRKRCYCVVDRQRHDELKKTGFVLLWKEWIFEIRSGKGIALGTVARRARYDSIRKDDPKTWNDLIIIHNNTALLQWTRTTDNRGIASEQIYVPLLISSAVKTVENKIRIGFWWVINFPSRQKRNNNKNTNMIKKKNKTKRVFSEGVV